MLVISLFNFFNRTNNDKNNIIAENQIETNQIETNQIETNEQLNKIQKKVTELQLCIEELNDNINDQEDKLDNLKAKHTNEISLLLEALISSADMLEDFYIFSQSLEDESFKQQSDIMWKTMQKKCIGAGLVRLQNENTETDTRYDNVIDGEKNNYIPRGNIIKSIRSGYLYKNKVVRKADVVVSTGELESE